MWSSVKYRQDTNQEKLGNTVATYEHETLGTFTYKEDRIDVAGKHAEFAVRAKAALTDWIASQSKYSQDETKILSALNL